MDRIICEKLFYETTYYKCKGKETNGDLRRLYEKYTGDYISSEDFINGLVLLGYKKNNNDDFMIRMIPNVKKLYYSNKITENMDFEKVE